MYLRGMASFLSLDELLEGVPPEKLNSPCKDIHLCQIAFSITDWEVIAPFLDISTSEAEAIKCDEGKTVRQKIGMLKKWKEKCGRRATYRRLAKRFLMVERVDLVDKICRVLGDSDSSSDDNSPAPDREVFVPQTILDQYADHLRRKYPKEIPNFAQWPPPPTRMFFNLAMIQKSRLQLGPIDEHYIRLTQRGNVDDIMLNKTAIQVKDIFHLHHGSFERLIVLIEGAPGAGKSTLAWYICDQWGSGNLFGEFKLVVFVQLRSQAVQSATSIADFLPRTSDGKEREVLSHLETRHGKEVLFVLDGWDEYSGGLTPDSICEKLIRRPGELYMQESTLLITSRPVASGELQQYCSTRIEIVGFAPKEVKEYFKDALKEAHQGEQQAEVLQECLKVRPVIQASCYLPLNASIVVHLFITEGNTLPTTYHGLFTSLVLNCIVRHVKKTRQEIGKRVPKIRSFETIPTELKPHFKAISALAFHGIMTNKASFSEEELHSFHLSTDSSAPLLSLIQGWSTFKSSWEDLSYSFFHLSVQELLAAFNISKQPHEHQVEVFRKLFGQPRFAAVLNYYAALTKFRVQGIREFIKETLQHSSGSVAVGVRLHQQAHRSEVRKVIHGTILDCLFEAHDPELCQYVATVMEGKLTVDYTMSPFHCMVLGYFLHCLCLTPGGGKLHIDLANCDLDEYKCSYLINELKKCTCGQPSLSMSLLQGEDSRGVSVLIRMLEESCSHCISDLSLALKANESTIKESLLNHSCGIPVVSLTIAALKSQRIELSDVRPVADFIVGSSHDTLKVLHLSGFVLFEEIAQALAASIKSSSILLNGKSPEHVGAMSVESAQQTRSGDSFFKKSALKTLRLSHCEIPHESATVLADCLAKNLNITVETLKLSRCAVPQEGLRILVESLSRQHHIKELSFSKCKISQENVLALAKVLRGSPSLENLTLSNTCIGQYSSGVDHLIDSFTVNPPQNLKVLDVSWSRIGLRGAKALESFLTVNQTLEALILSNNDLSHVSATKTCTHHLAQGLRKNQSLKSLSIARCLLGKSELVTIVEALEQHPSLQELEFHGNALSVSEFKALSERVKEITQHAEANTISTKH